MSSTQSKSGTRPQDHPTYEALIDHVNLWASRQTEPPAESEIAQKVDQFGDLVVEDAPAIVRAAVVAEILTRVQTTVEPGIAVAKDRDPWIHELRNEPDFKWPYWEAYRQLLLAEGRGREPMQELRRSVEDILDLSGDPRVEGAWQRRGLVMGDVQSGKTSNFIGLMNMAADAGYRLFIVIGGHTEDLRSQTQKRVDEGFIGRRSLDAGGNGLHSDPVCGVGDNRRDFSVISVTTEESDFEARSKRTTHFGNLSTSISAPVVLVVKKNSKILQNLAEWLPGMGGAHGLNVPMMLIDDEADYASVNTNKKDKAESTAVNAAIRNLLACSQRATYVGFTATPFANVLIDPQAEDDLFPRDYIYSLMAPSDYMGALDYFGDEHGKRHSRVDVGDAEDFFPFGHKRDIQVPGLPDSLKRAVEAFVLVCVITDLRGDRSAPRSMLVNVSRFNDVQTQVHRLVSDYLDEIGGTVQFADPAEMAAGAGPALIRSLYQTWLDEYSATDHSWKDVANQLPSSVDVIETELVNRDTDKERQRRAQVRARARHSHGRRVISVGGTILSRGLTLDGLVVSYFYQRTQLSDTLLQMGRWFGYRKGYRDLVRVWLDPEVRSWFRFVAFTLEEIRADIRLMESAGATPQDFGLKIRRHPEALKITAANKMRHAESRVLSMSFAQQRLETKTASLAPSAWETNRRALADLMLACEGQSRDSSLPAELGAIDQHIGFSRVDRAAVEDFLQTFVPGSKDMNFSRTGGDLSLIAEYVRSEATRHGDLWDVAVIGGSGEKAEVPGLGKPLPGNRRDTARVHEWRGRYLAFSSRRIASEGNLLDVARKLHNGPRERWAHVARTDDAIKEYAVPGVIDRPILMIYPVSWTPEKPDPVQDPVKTEAGMLGLMVTFPAVRDELGNLVEATEKAEYVVNRVWMAEAGLLDEIDEEVSDDG